MVAKVEKLQWQLFLLVLLFMHCTTDELDQLTRCIGNALLFILLFEQHLICLKI